MIKVCLVVFLYAFSASSYFWKDLGYTELSKLTYPALTLNVGGKMIRICHVNCAGKVIANPKLILGALTKVSGLSVPFDPSVLRLVVDEEKSQEISKKLCWYRLWVGDHSTERYVLVELLPSDNTIPLETFDCATPKTVLDCNIDLAIYILRGHWTHSKTNKVVLAGSSTFDVELRWTKDSSKKQTERACQNILHRLKSYYPQYVNLDGYVRHALETTVLYIVKCPGTDTLYFLDDGTENILFELKRYDHGPFVHTSSVQQSRTYESDLKKSIKKDPAFADFKGQSLSLLNEHNQPKKRLLFGCLPLCW